jgi:hypothetical protein
VIHPLTYDPEWKRHHVHPKALCRRGSMQSLVKLGVCTTREFVASMHQVKQVKRRNRYWAALGYPNLVKARAARTENVRRRRELLKTTARDHSVDHLLELCGPTLPR